MTETTEALVLHTLRYGDTGLISDLFLPSRGTQTFIFPSAKRRAALLSPLSFIELTYDFRPQKNLQRARELHAALPYRTIPYQPLKTSLALFLAEFLYNALRHETQNEPLYAYLRAALTWLDEAETGYTNFHLALLIHLTRFLGLWPRSDDYHEGDLFDLLEARFVSLPPPHGAALTAPEARMLSKYLRMDYTNMDHFRLNRQLRRTVLERLTQYYRLHIPEFGEVRSVDVLRELFE